jgi:hypothetical protein
MLPVDGDAMRIVLATAALLSCFRCSTALAEEKRSQDASSRPPKMVTAILNDGRHISGRVASTTDDNRLDLIVSSERVDLTAHLKWEQVDSFKVRDRQLSVARLRKQLSKYLQPEQPTNNDRAKPRRITPLLNEETGEPNVSHQSTPRSVQMEARLTSWDQDAKPDGLLLEFFVLDGTGHPTVAPGQLTAKLTGIRQEITGGRGTLDRKQPVTPLEQWSLAVRHSDFVDGRAVVKLPFRMLQPDRDLNIAAETLLEISYGVSSVGVFNASQPDVLIRQPSRFRDELFLSTGNRLLPSEAPANQPDRPLIRDPRREIFRPGFRDQ